MEPLYQVHVLNTKGLQQPVGPRMVRKAAEQFRDAIEMQIRKGAEKDWKQPLVVECRSTVQ